MVCVTRLPDIDDDDVVEVEGADAVEFAVEARVSEAAMDCDDADDCAAAKPTKADTMKDFEKYMAVVFVRGESTGCITSMRLMERVVQATSALQAGLARY